MFPCKNFDHDYNKHVMHLDDHVHGIKYKKQSHENKTLEISEW